VVSNGTSLPEGQAVGTGSQGGLLTTAQFIMIIMVSMAVLIWDGQALTTIPLVFLINPNINPKFKLLVAVLIQESLQLMMQ